MELEKAQLSDALECCAVTSQGQQGVKKIPFLYSFLFGMYFFVSFTFFLSLLLYLV